jgi:hypothetical protein
MADTVLTLGAVAAPITHGDPGNFRVIKKRTT